MSKRTEEYLKNVPMKPYDVLREGLVVLALATVVVVVLAAIFKSPDYPTVRGEDVANLEPIAFLQTSADILAGNHGVQDYGPPYTSDTDNAQRILGVAPANWFGATIPVDPTQDLVLAPLQRVAMLNSDVASALQEYQAASPDQQQTWTAAYIDGLGEATVENGEVSVPTGDYGPVATMMNGMLALGRAGLLEGALDSGSGLPYSLDNTKSLLFFQDDVDAGVADTLNMAGDQWGVTNETGRFPGAWWLWPYSFLYQIRPMSTSANADIEAMGIAAGAFLLLILLPFIPIVRWLPRYTGIHRLIWRDWYRRRDSGSPQGGAST
ncbi:MAG: hypothetical protein ABR978_05350 [Dehalococcoidia bacterium]|jgi:hypothetical protein